MKNIILLTFIFLIYQHSSFGEVRSDTLHNQILAGDSLNSLDEISPLRALINTLPTENRDSIFYVTGRILEQIRNSHEKYTPIINEGYNGIEIISFLEDIGNEKTPPVKRAMMEELYYELLNGQPLEVEKEIEKELKHNKGDETLIRLRLFCAVHNREEKSVKKYLERLLSVNPASLPGNALKGLILYNVGKWAESRNYYNKTVKILPEYAAGYINIGYCNEHLNLPYEAIGNFRKSLEYYPDNASAYNEMGVLYMDDSTDVAKRMFTEAIRLNPGFVWPYNNLGVTWRKAGNNDSAIYWYSRAISTNPSYTQAIKNRADLYMSEKKYEEAKTDYSTCIEQEPQHAEYYAHRGNAYYFNKEPEEAIANFKKALEIAGNYAYAAKRTGDCYSYLNDFSTAVIYYNDAVKMSPSFEDAINSRGDAFYKLGNLKEALKDYNRCIQMDPGYPYYFKDRGNLYFRINQTQAAIDDFKKAVELDSTYAYAWARLGDCYYFDKKFEEAIGYYEKAFALDSGYYYASYSIGMCYSGLSDYKSAIKDLKISISIDSTFSPALGNLGWMYYRIDDFDHCIYYSRRAIALDDDAFYAKFNLALATLRKGEVEEANDLYRTYLMESLMKKADIAGAVNDLKDLVKKDIMADEARFIIHNILKAN